MFDLIKEIISHVWVNDQYTSEQQYIYFICGAMIIVLTVWVLDSLTRFIINIGRKRG